MDQDQIEQGLKMVAMGRLNHPATIELVEALAALLATPEDRLAAVVKDEPEPKPASKTKKAK